MAKPQLEDGYTPIANEILERLARTSLPPNQWQVLLFIIRKTYGFHKKVDCIANFQIIEATGLGKTVVSRCLKGLSDMQLITRKGKYIGFQKDWESWKKVAEQSIKVCSSEVTQKIKYTKQNKLVKRKYGEFVNVLLTDGEYQKLKDNFGVRVSDMIETLSRGIASRGYRYESHYATILSWERREEKEKEAGRGAHRGHSKQASTQELKDSIGRPLD